MATECLKPVGGTRMRVTELDECGTPVTGVGSCFIVSSGFVSVERNAEYADPDQFIVKNAGGAVCLKHRTRPQFLWYTFNINFCEVDVDLYSLVTGSTIVEDFAVSPNNVGFRTNEDTMGTTNFALEIWTLLSGEECTTGDVPYGYWMAPFIGEGTVGTPLRFENGPVSFTVSNARTKGGGNWGQGPYDVVPDALGVAAPLKTAMLPTEHDHFQLTTIAPPAAACGCQTLAP